MWFWKTEFAANDPLQQYLVNHHGSLIKSIQHIFIRQQQIFKAKLEKNKNDMMPMLVQNIRRLLLRKKLLTCKQMMIKNSCQKQQVRLTFWAKNAHYTNYQPFSYNYMLEYCLHDKIKKKLKNKFVKAILIQKCNRNLPTSPFVSFPIILTMKDKYIVFVAIVL